MTPPPKRPRPFGRLPQCNKRIRLTRRHYGQWVPQTDAQLPNRLKELVP
mgnify:CR=1 FL=1